MRRFLILAISLAAVAAAAHLAWKNLPTLDSDITPDWDY